MGDVFLTGRDDIPQQPVPDATAGIGRESPLEAPAAANGDSEAPIGAVEPPAAPEPAIRQTVMERDPAGAAARVLPAGLDDAVSASASLLGSVAGGFGLAAVAGGGLVIIGLGAALGAWYSVALANSYLGRR